MAVFSRSAIGITVIRGNLKYYTTIGNYQTNYFFNEYKVLCISIISIFNEESLVLWLGIDFIINAANQISIVICTKSLMYPGVDAIKKIHSYFRNLLISILHSY